MMKAIKFNSLELYKNKKTTILGIVFFLSCCVFANAQNVVKETVAEKKSIAEVSLNQRFSSKVLNAYQENSTKKVEDLFSYFEMLTDANLLENTKQEIIKNIYLLYKNKSETVIDFTSNKFEKIPLNLFIEKLLVSKPIVFTVLNEVNFNLVDYQSWNINYTVSKTELGIKTNVAVTQKIYFYETQKAFGSTTKMVLTTYLGKM